MFWWHEIDFLAVAFPPFKYLLGFSKEVSLASLESMELLVDTDLNLLNADAFEINSGILGFNSSARLTLKTDSWVNRFWLELGWPVLDMVVDLYTVGAAVVLGASFLSCSEDRPKPGIWSEACIFDWPVVLEDSYMLGVVLGENFLSCSEDRPKPGICSKAYKVGCPVVLEDPHMLGGTLGLDTSFLSCSEEHKGSWSEVEDPCMLGATVLLGASFLNCSDDRPKPQICSEAYKVDWPVMVEDPCMLGGTWVLGASFLSCSEDRPRPGICSEEHRGGCLKLRKEFTNGLEKSPRNGKESCGKWGYKLGIMDVPWCWIEHVDRWQGGDPELRKKSKNYILNFF